MLSNSLESFLYFSRTTVQENLFLALFFAETEIFFLRSSLFIRISIFSAQSLTLIAEVKLAEATYKSYESFPI